MKTIIILLAIILSLGCVNAIVNENNYVFNGTLENGNYHKGTTPIKDVNILGFVCASANCTTVSSIFLTGSTGITNHFLIQYPTNPTLFGYGLYFYKNGYIPLGGLADYWGNRDVPDMNNYLYKKAFCFSNLNQIVISGNTSLGSTLNVNTRVFAAIDNDGQPTYIPPQIVDQFQHQVQVDLYITNRDTLQTQHQSQLVTLNFSSFRDINFSFIPTVAGNYTFNVTTSIPTSSPDAKCISFIPRSSVNDSIQILNPPVSVSLPTIQIISPLNITYNTSNILVNLSQINATNVFWNNGTANITYNLSAPPIPYNFSEGSHTIIAYANNSAGTVSANVTFFVNTTRPITIPMPTITIISPENRTYNNSLITITLQANNETSIIWNNGTANFTYIGPLNYSFPEGANRIIAYAINQNNTASASVNFFVNTTLPIPPVSLPLIQIISPLNTTYNTSNILVNLSQINATNVFWNNGTANITYTNPILYNFSEGSHTILAYANNSAGTVSANVTFFVNLTRPIILDTTAPVITIISPQPITYNTSNISLEIITNENATSWFSFNNTNTTMIPLNATHFISNLTNLQNGNYTVIFYARDNSENLASISVTFSIILNQPAPDNPIDQPARNNNCIKKDKLEDVNPYADNDTEVYQGNKTSSQLYPLILNSEDKSDNSWLYIIILLILNIIFLVILIRVIKS